MLDASAVVGELNDYLGLMRYLPAMLLTPDRHLIGPTWEVRDGWEIILFDEPQHSLARRVMRDDTNKFLSSITVRQPLAKGFLRAANYYNKVLSVANVGVRMAQTGQSLLNDDPSVIANGLKLASSLVTRAPMLAVRGNALALALQVYAESAQAVLAAGQRIRDRLIAQALVAARDRPAAQSPERYVYSLAEVRDLQTYGTYDWTERETQRVATVLQARFILAALTRSQ